MTKDNLQPLAFSVSEAAKVSSLSRSQLYLLMAENKLQYKLVGKRRVIPRSALAELVGEAA